MLMTFNQRLWWQAYCAAITGSAFQNETSIAQEADAAKGAADEAVDTYHKRWVKKASEGEASGRWTVAYVLVGDCRNVFHGIHANDRETALAMANHLVPKVAEVALSVSVEEEP